jgi:hypothetical protein
MTKLPRLAFSIAAAALVSLALSAPTVNASFCRPAFFIAFDEQDCAATCHSRDCNYQYNPETNECVCSHS